MPDSVKISELIPRTALGTDVLPAVDATFTSTVRLTAADIAAIGGGPPGDGLVSTVKLAAKAVTYPKIQDVTANKLLGRTATTGQVEEIPCSQLGRDFLACTTQYDARNVISALAGMNSPPFTGQVKLQPGSESAPSLTMGDLVPDPDNLDLTTGLYFPAKSTVGITTDSSLKWYIDGEGTQYTNIAGSTTMRPSYSCRAWVSFNGSGSGSTTIKNQATIAQRFGLTNSLYNDGDSGATVIKIKADELSLRGNTISAVGSAAADGRTNYSSPGDNTHWYWDTTSPAQWRKTPASGKTWIGNITYSATNTRTILASGGVSSVVWQATGKYRVNFLTAMPDNSYAVVATGTVTTWSNSVGDHIVNRDPGIAANPSATPPVLANPASSYFEVWHYENNALVDSSYISVAVFR